VRVSECHQQMFNGEKKKRISTLPPDACQSLRTFAFFCLDARKRRRRRERHDHSQRQTILIALSPGVGRSPADHAKLYVCMYVGMCA
jgi:hypothetical protein